MAILGIGVDLLALPRLRSLLARRGADRLASRILSGPEHLLWASRSSWTSEREQRFLATRWAAKEAAYKALFPSYRVTWKTLNVRKEGGKPVLELLGEGEELRVHLSLSHDGEYVVAYVVVEREGG